MSDALFGVDGTQMPESFSAPSNRRGAQDEPALPPFVLPPLPDSSVIREALAAELDGDASGLLDQDFSPQSTTPQPPAQPDAAAVAAPPPNMPSSNVTAPLPKQGAPQAAMRPPPGPPRPIRRAVQPPPPAPAGPPQPLPGKLDRSPYRPPVARGSRRAAQLGDLRRRVSSTGLPAATRSNGGAGVFFVVAAAIFVVLAYEVIVGIVEAIARLIP
jgi:hypothetical protein